MELTIQRTHIVHAGLCCVALLSGCAGKKNHAEPWALKPQVGWFHISTQPVEPFRNQFRIVAPLPTHGLFPGNIAVTRVGIEMLDETIQTARPIILKDPRNELLQWNAAFDDQMAVSEVFPIDQFDLGGGEAEPRQILAAFRALQARMGLLYAMNETSSTSSQMIGVLYDVESGSPIAYFHAHADSVPPPINKDENAPEDWWKTDSKAIVRARFTRLVYDCIRTLILQDQADVPEVPTGWQPVMPTFPVEWPPRLPRNGR